MIALIDNYDSFTYNIFQVLAALGADVRVVRNDQTTVDEIASWKPSRLLISPGPGGPADAGISVSAIRRFAGRIPVLGVCLGHQALVHAFGGEIVRADRLMHGKTSMVHHDGRTLFARLPNPFEATRYHSLIARRESLPAEFEVSAETDGGEVMGVRHRPTGAEGVQFHPESVLCEAGPLLLEAFATC
jgi:anthranilate synthase/aminodeoxychorismate synthase-like glutamine amidotransferase